MPINGHELARMTDLTLIKQLATKADMEAVSYTHLDVYKRQDQGGDLPPPGRGRAAGYFGI